MTFFQLKSTDSELPLTLCLWSCVVSSLLRKPCASCHVLGSSTETVALSLKWCLWSLVVLNSSPGCDSLIVDQTELVQLPRSTSRFLYSEFSSSCRAAWELVGQPHCPLDRAWHAGGSAASTLKAPMVTNLWASLFHGGFFSKSYFSMLLWETWRQDPLQRGVSVPLHSDEPQNLYLVSVP